MPELSRRERLIRLAGVAPLVPLALATVLTVVGTGDAVRPAGPTIALATVALATVAAAWMGLLLAHRRWEHRAGWRLGYFGGLLGLMTALTSWSPWYGLVAGVAGPQALLLFHSSRGALVGLVAACVLPTAVRASVSSSGLPEPSYPLLLSLVLPLVAAGWVAGRENDRRRALLRELTEARQELVDQAHRAGIAAERVRITGELHDTLTQALAATVTQLEAAQHTDDQPQQQRQLARASALARDGLAESRRMLRALGPGALEGRTLSDALLAMETQLPDTISGCAGSNHAAAPDGSGGPNHADGSDASDGSDGPARRARSEGPAHSGGSDDIGHPEGSAPTAGSTGTAATAASTGTADAGGSTGTAGSGRSDGSDRSDESDESDDRGGPERAGRPSLRVEIVGTAVAVPPEIEHALYRVATEAVTNAVRHAYADTVHVSLSWLDDLVLLDVTDDGVGFSPDASPAPDRSGLGGPSAQDRDRFGLATMRQRVRHVGGELIVESEPGGGTAISASVPLTVTTGQGEP